MDFDVKLEPLLLHKRELLGLFPTPTSQYLVAADKRAAGHALSEAAVDNAFAAATVELLRDHHVIALRQTLLEGSLREGKPVWEEVLFHFRGRAAFEKFYGGDMAARIAFTAALPELTAKIQGDFAVEHVVHAASAPGHLTGNVRLFLFGYVQALNSLDPVEVTLRPLLFGRRVEIGSFGTPVRRSLFVSPEEIREFSRIETQPAQTLNPEPLKRIPEATMKHWFAKLVHEGHVPKDWGGEQSDLWTPQLHIGDEPVRAAIIFKGPSSFHPMKLPDLGKNGDQIRRLFDVRYGAGTQHDGDVRG